MSSVHLEKTNPYAPPQAEVVDPRGGDANVQLAGLGSRFGAAVLDGLAFVLCLLPSFIGIDFEAFSAAALAEDSGAMLAAFSMTGFVVTGLAILGLVALNAYFVVVNSQSLGKKLVGIKVVRTDGSRASFARIFWLRNVVNALPSVIPIVSNIYTIVDHLFIFHSSRRCVHDRIADTKVVDA